MEQELVKSEIKSLTTPADLLAMAVQSNASIDTLERLMALKERFDAAEAEKALSEALSHFQGDVPEIPKDAEVDFTSQKGRTHYRYSSLGAILRIIKDIEVANGLSHSWKTQQAAGVLTVTCTVRHVAGGSTSVTLFGPYDETGNKNSLQQIGSATSYLQRYTLLSALGLGSVLSTQEDDDSQSGGVEQARPFTALQRQKVIHFIQEGKALDLYCYIQELGQGVYTGIFGSFDDGKKHDQKVTARNLESDGRLEFEAIVTTLREALDGEDSLAFLEVYEELEFTGKILAWQEFSTQQKSTAKEYLSNV